MQCQVRSSKDTQAVVTVHTASEPTVSRWEKRLTQLAQPRRVACRGPNGFYQRVCCARTILGQSFYIVGREQTRGTCASIRAAPPIFAGELDIDDLVTFGQGNFIVLVHLVVVQRDGLRS